MNDRDVTMICGHVTRGARLQTACELEGATLEELFAQIEDDAQTLLDLFLALNGRAHAQDAMQQFDL